MTASSIRLPLGIVAALAAVVVGAPAASAGGLDPAIYDAGVLPGQVEHGVYSFTITGSPSPQNRRIEYWISADRWRQQTTDTKTGELIGGALHDAGGTTWLQYKPINGDPKVFHYKGNDSVPGPGYPAAYNRKLAETGVTQGPESSPIAVTLQPIGPQTIAGFAGTAYERLSNGQPGLSGGPEGASVKDSKSIVVLQDGTFQPLLRETSAANGSFGRFTQREVLISRETTSTANAGVQLTKLGFARTVTKWKAKVKAAKKKHHKK
jgi:hypothetical protein